MHLATLKSVATFMVCLLATTTTASPEAAAAQLASPSPRRRSCHPSTPIYKDPSYPIEARVDDLVSRMTIEEKAGQLFQNSILAGPFNEAPAGRNSTYDVVAKKKISHFNLSGTVTNATETAKFVNELQELALNSTRLGIPITLSTDPRHAFTDNIGTGFQAGSFSQWPETLGLAALRDPQLVRQYANVVRQEYLAVGFKAALHPQVDILTEERWARSTGTWGSDSDLTASLVGPYVKGLQLGGTDEEGDAQRTFGKNSISATTKHFPGSGPVEDGLDSHFTYGKNLTYHRGIDSLEYHLKPFKAAFAAGTRQIMPAYSRPQGLQKWGFPAVAMGFNKPMITGLLRSELGFDGVVVTDWGLVTDGVILGQDMPARAWGMEDKSELERMQAIFDAGCDQLGGETRTDLAIELMQKGLVDIGRIDNSIKKLMREKFILGLFDQPFVDAAAANTIVGREDFVKLGAETQRRSYTLLTNNGTVLPLKKPTETKFYIEGFNATYMAARDLTVVATPEEADLALIRIKSPAYPRPGGFESQYGGGDVVFNATEIARQAKIYETVPTIVDVILSRAVAIPEIFQGAAAVLGSYGSGAEAFLDVITGVVKPEGKLPFDLPRSQKAVEEALEDVPDDTKDPVFKFGYGLSYE